jgi:cell division protein FtsW (lipid II flippase)
MGYQLYQSKLMISLGGVTGSADAAGVHLPFDHTDFIFSVIAGRWGLVGVSVTLGMFALLFWRGFRIAAVAEDPFGRLTALGLVVMLATQGIINLAMTVGLAPITGLTLPFVSYGGSSLLTCFVSTGVLLSIRRQHFAAWRFDFESPIGQLA